MYVHVPYFTASTHFPTLDQFVAGLLRSACEAEWESGQAIMMLEVPFIQDDRWSQVSGVLNELFFSIQANLMEPAALSSIRDALLPKLMSGEIDVSQVELPA